MRTTIAVKGAREHNLKNIDVEIPRDKLVVITGLSGSGKSSLAFDTIYAEGQRRFMESLSAYAKRRIAQVKKPDVEFVFGLSPVVSIEQKTGASNPRSTIGTMTDIYDYLRILYSTVGEAHCPYCRQPVPTKTPHQIVEHILAQPPGTPIEISTPIFKFYGEDYNYLFADVRSKGSRRVRVDGELLDISEELDLDESRTYAMQAIVDKVIVQRGSDKPLLASIEHGLRVGEGFLQFRLLDPDRHPNPAAFYAPFGCAEHHSVWGQMEPVYFTFNDLTSACPTCMGLGTYLKVHPELMVPDKTRSVKGKAFIPEVFKWDPNGWHSRIVYSMAAHYGIELDAPFSELSPEHVDLLLYGTKGEKFELVLPPGATKGDQYVGRTFRFDGFINNVERNYRRFRKEAQQNSQWEEWLKRMMIEHVCADCHGTKLKQQRLLIELNNKNIYELGELPISAVRAFFDQITLPPRQREVGTQIMREITNRLDLLLGIGLDYLSLNRKATTLSGGEAQRIRLSTQIGSGLMGMLYVLDEPSIGLHPKDTIKVINTLKQLRDIGNSVLVVEHDEETTRAADHIIEVGPGPGVHGGNVVAQGTIDEILHHPQSLTGHYLSGRQQIAVPAERRAPNGKRLVVRGARENNLRTIDVEIPLGLFICVTGASGSGKSTLINDILYKKLYALFHDPRVLAGAHDRIEGVEHIGDVVNIDQTPIGRSSRSNPATYIGFYDKIRELFSKLPEAEARHYDMGRFSFNCKGGRCEECMGEGLITTQLFFMPDVEAPCPTCKGARYNEETLEVTYKGKNIAEVLDLSIEEGAAFFADHKLIAHKIGILHQLGLGYLKLGHPAPHLSGGEAQRIKLAKELGKLKRGAHNLYILDEPTTGLHLADIERLLASLNRLVDAGNTVLVIEHHLDVIKTADWVIDMGLDGGNAGGEVIAQGTPEAITQSAVSYTGHYLRQHLR